MDANNLMLPTVSEAHPETLDFLSRSWCDFAIQALQPELHDRSPLSVPNTTMKMFEGDTLVSSLWFQQGLMMLLTQ